MKIIFFLTLWMVLVPTANAGIDTRIGNFYISYNDLVLKDIAVIGRTYNSKAVEVGVFGFGWGSPMDTRLIIGPSGLPIIFYGGSGATQYYNLDNNTNSLDFDSQKYTDLMISHLIDDAISKETIGTNDDLLVKIRGEILSKLEETQYRTKQWDNLVARGKLDPIGVGHIPVNTRFIYTCSCSYGVHALKYTGTGFEHNYNGKTEVFDLNGNILSTSTDGETFYFQRSATNPDVIEKIRTSSGDDVIIKYNDSGNIIEALLKNSNKKASYKYENDNLIYSQDVGGNIYEFEYDERHNLTKINYIDSTFVKIDYDENNFVVGYEDESGNKTNYTYGFLEGDSSLNYFTSIRYKPFGGSSRTEKWEFYNERINAGRTMLTKEVSEANGIRRAFFYNKSGVLDQIKTSSILSSSNHELSIKYKFDDFGRVKDIEGKDWNKTYAYYEGSERVVKEIVTRQGIRNSISKFEYNKKGLLTKAISEASEVKVAYGADDSRIKSLEKNGQKINVIRTGDAVSGLELLENGKLTGTLKIKKTNIDRLTIDTEDYKVANKVMGVLGGMIAICQLAESEFTIF